MKKDKTKYEIVDNYLFIEIEDKDYGYSIEDESFAIKQLIEGYDDLDFECYGTYYLKIKYDYLTGEKLEVSAELQTCIDKAKLLRKRLEDRKRKEKEKEARECERQQKRYEQEQKRKYKEYVKEFGKEQADKIMEVEDTPKMPNFAKMFENVNHLISIPKFDTQRDKYVENLRNAEKGEI